MNSKNATMGNSPTYVIKHHPIKSQTLQIFHISAYVIVTLFLVHLTSVTSSPSLTYKPTDDLTTQPQLHRDKQTRDVYSKTTILSQRTIKSYRNVIRQFIQMKNIHENISTLKTTNPVRYLKFRTDALSKPEEYSILNEKFFSHKNQPFFVILNKSNYNSSYYWSKLEKQINFDQSTGDTKIRFMKLEKEETVENWKNEFLKFISNMSYSDYLKLCEVFSSVPGTSSSPLPCQYNNDKEEKYEQNQSRNMDDPVVKNFNDSLRAPSISMTTASPNNANLFTMTNEMLHNARIKRNVNFTMEQPALRYVKMAILVPMYQNRPFCLQRTVAAIEIAIQKAETEILNGVQIRPQFADSHCSISDGMNAAIEFYARGWVNVFMGPVCDYAVAPIARQLRYWEIPLLTPGALAGDFGYNKPLMFPFLTRLGTNFNTLLDFFHTLIDVFGWTKIKMLYHPNGFNTVMDRYCHIATDGIIHGLRRRHSNVTCDHKSFHSVPKVLEVITSEIGNTWSGGREVAECLSVMLILCTVPFRSMRF